MATIARGLDNPPHKVKVFWVDKTREHHTYSDVNTVRHGGGVWWIRFMDGRVTQLQFSLVLCIDMLEPTCAEAHQKEVNDFALNNPGVDSVPGFREFIGKIEDNESKAGK